MNKRICALAFTLALLVLLSTMTWASAATVEVSGGTGNTNMTYTVAQSFSVTIPESVAIDAETKKGQLTINVSANATIPYGKSILVKLTTCDFQFTNSGDNLDYLISKGAGENLTQINKDDTVLQHDAGSQSVSGEVLNITVTGSAKYSGTYTDSVTFTVSVEATPSAPVGG